MNLILLFEDDFVSDDEVRLSGRRLEHVMNVHRANAGDELKVGVCGGRIGSGIVTRLDDALEMRVTLDRVAHPHAQAECPRAVEGAVMLAIGPEGGFIAEEIASLERIGFQAVSIGARVLRVETAVAALIGRLY